MNMLKIIEYIKEKTRPTRRRWRQWKKDFVPRYRPKLHASRLYEEWMGEPMNWNHPQGLGEKIIWMMFNTDTTEWTRLADKYAVRDFVKERGCGEILIPLYAKWDRVEDIEWDKLPNSFAIKTNHACGNTRIVRNRKEVDVEELKEYYRNELAKPYGIYSAEPHYRHIKPCIIVEELLMQGSKSLEVTELGAATIEDYKIWCFNGEPTYIFTVTDRNMQTHAHHFNVYDLDWHKHNEWISEVYRNDVILEKPKHLEKMLEYAKKLSKGFPQVRVDLYECNDRIYFGEMTFTSAAGRMIYFTPQFLKIMGDKCHICRK